MSAAQPDAAGRGVAVAIAAGRLALGVAISASTRRAITGLGFETADEGTVALARLAGGRDIALGIHGLLARDDPRRLAESSAIATGVDLGDGIAFALALSSGRLGKRALVNIPLIAGAVGAGAWATSRLRTNY